MLDKKTVCPKNPWDYSFLIMSHGFFGHTQEWGLRDSVRISKEAPFLGLKYNLIEIIQEKTGKTEGHLKGGMET